MEITIAGRTIGLKFCMAQMEALEKYRDGKPLNVRELSEELNDWHTVLDVIEILSSPDGPDREWMLQNIRPGQLPMIMTAVYQTIGEGMAMETADEEEQEGPVDVTLEEIKKKETPGG